MASFENGDAAMPATVDQLVMEVMPLLTRQMETSAFGGLATVAVGCNSISTDQIHSSFVSGDGNASVLTDILRTPPIHFDWANPANDIVDANSSGGRRRSTATSLTNANNKGHAGRPVSSSNLAVLAPYSKDRNDVTQRTLFIENAIRRKALEDTMARGAHWVAIWKRTAAPTTSTAAAAPHLAATAQGPYQSSAAASPSTPIFETKEEIAARLSAEFRCPPPAELTALESQQQPVSPSSSPTSPLQQAVRERRRSEADLSTSKMQSVVTFKEGSEGGEGGDASFRQQQQQQQQQMVSTDGSLLENSFGGVPPPPLTSLVSVEDNARGASSTSQLSTSATAASTTPTLQRTQSQLFRQQLACDTAAERFIELVSMASVKENLKETVNGGPSSAPTAKGRRRRSSSSGAPSPPLPSFPRTALKSAPSVGAAEESSLNENANANDDPLANSTSAHVATASGGGSNPNQKRTRKVVFTEEVHTANDGDAHPASTEAPPPTERPTTPPPPRDVHLSHRALLNFVSLGKPKKWQAARYERAATRLREVMDTQFDMFYSGSCGGGGYGGDGGGALVSGSAVPSSSAAAAAVLKGDVLSVVDSLSAILAESKKNQQGDKQQRSSSNTNSNNKPALAISSTLAGSNNNQRNQSSFGNLEVRKQLLATLFPSSSIAGPTPTSEGSEDAPDRRLSVASSSALIPSSSPPPLMSNQPRTRFLASMLMAVPGDGPDEADEGDLDDEHTNGVLPEGAGPPIPTASAAEGAIGESAGSSKKKVKGKGKKAAKPAAVEIAPPAEGVPTPPIPSPSTTATTATVGNRAKQPSSSPSHFASSVVDPKDPFAMLVDLIVAAEEEHEKQCVERRIDEEARREREGRYGMGGNGAAPQPESAPLPLPSSSSSSSHHLPIDHLVTVHNVEAFMDSIINHYNAEVHLAARRKESALLTEKPSPALVAVASATPAAEGGAADTPSAAATAAKKATKIIHKPEELAPTKPIAITKAPSKKGKDSGKGKDARGKGGGPRRSTTARGGRGAGADGSSAEESSDFDDFSSSSDSAGGSRGGGRSDSSEDEDEGIISNGVAGAAVGSGKRRTEGQFLRFGEDRRGFSREERQSLKADYRRIKAMAKGEAFSFEERSAIVRAMAVRRGNDGACFIPPPPPAALGGTPSLRPQRSPTVSPTKSGGGGGGFLSTGAFGSQPTTPRQGPLGAKNAAGTKSSSSSSPMAKPTTTGGSGGAVSRTTSLAAVGFALSPSAAPLSSVRRQSLAQPIARFDESLVFDERDAMAPANYPSAEDDAAHRRRLSEAKGEMSLERSMSILKRSASVAAGVGVGGGGDNGGGSLAFGVVLGESSGLISSSALRSRMAAAKGSTSAGRDANEASGLLNVDSNENSQNANRTASSSSSPIQQQGQNALVDPNFSRYHVGVTATAPYSWLTRAYDPHALLPYKTSRGGAGGGDEGEEAMVAFGELITTAAIPPTTASGPEGEGNDAVTTAVVSSAAGPVSLLAQYQQQQSLDQQHVLPSMPSKHYADAMQWLEDATGPAALSIHNALNLTTTTAANAQVSAGVTPPPSPPPSVAIAALRRRAAVILKHQLFTTLLPADGFVAPKKNNRAKGPAVSTNAGKKESPTSTQAKKSAAKADDTEAADPSSTALNPDSPHRLRLSKDAAALALILHYIDDYVLDEGEEEAATSGASKGAAAKIAAGAGLGRGRRQSSLIAAIAARKKKSTPSASDFCYVYIDERDKVAKGLTERCEEERLIRQSRLDAKKAAMRLRREVGAGAAAGGGDSGGAGGEGSDNDSSAHDALDATRKYASNDKLKVSSSSSNLIIAAAAKVTAQKSSHSSSSSAALIAGATRRATIDKDELFTTQRCVSEDGQSQSQRSNNGNHNNASTDSDNDDDPVGLRPICVVPTAAAADALRLDHAKNLDELRRQRTAARLQEKERRLTERAAQREAKRIADKERRIQQRRERLKRAIEIAAAESRDDITPADIMKTPPVTGLGPDTEDEDGADDADLLESDGGAINSEDAMLDEEEDRLYAAGQAIPVLETGVEYVMHDPFSSASTGGVVGDFSSLSAAPPPMIDKIIFKDNDDLFNNAIANLRQAVDRATAAERAREAERERQEAERWALLLAQFVKQLDVAEAKARIDVERLEKLDRFGPLESAHSEAVRNIQKQTEKEAAFRAFILLENEEAYARAQLIVEEEDALAALEKLEIIENTKALATIRHIITFPAFDLFAAAPSEAEQRKHYKAHVDATMEAHRQAVIAAGKSGLRQTVPLPPTIPPFVYVPSVSFVQKEPFRIIFDGASSIVESSADAAKGLRKPAQNIRGSTSRHSGDPQQALVMEEGEGEDYYRFRPDSLFLHSLVCKGMLDIPAAMRIREGAGYTLIDDDDEEEENEDDSSVGNISGIHGAGAELSRHGSVGGPISRSNSQQSLGSRQSVTPERDAMKAMALMTDLEEAQYRDALRRESVTSRRRSSLAGGGGGGGGASTAKRFSTGATPSSLGGGSTPQQQQKRSSVALSKEDSKRQKQLQMIFTEEAFLNDDEAVNLVLMAPTPPPSPRESALNDEEDAFPTLRVLAAAPANLNLNLAGLAGIGAQKPFAGIAPSVHPMTLLLEEELKKKHKRDEKERRRLEQQEALAALIADGKKVQERRRSVALQQHLQRKSLAESGGWASEGESDGRRSVSGRSPTNRSPTSRSPNHSPSAQKSPTSLSLSTTSTQSVSKAKQQPYRGKKNAPSDGGMGDALAGLMGLNGETEERPAEGQSIKMGTAGGGGAGAKKTTTLLQLDIDLNVGDDVPSANGDREVLIKGKTSPSAGAKTGGGALLFKTADDSDDYDERRGAPPRGGAITSLKPKKQAKIANSAEIERREAELAALGGGLHRSDQMAEKLKRKESVAAKKARLAQEKLLAEQRQFDEETNRLDAEYEAELEATQKMSFNGGEAFFETARVTEEELLERQKRAKLEFYQQKMAERKARRAASLRSGSASGLLLGDSGSNNSFSMAPTTAYLESSSTYNAGSSSMPPTASPTPRYGAGGNVGVPHNRPMSQSSDGSRLQTPLPLGPSASAGARIAPPPHLAFAAGADGYVRSNLPPLPPSSGGTTHRPPNTGRTHTPHTDRSAHYAQRLRAEEEAAHRRAVEAEAAAEQRAAEEFDGLLSALKELRGGDADGDGSDVDMDASDGDDFDDDFSSNGGVAGSGSRSMLESENEDDTENVVDTATRKFFELQKEFAALDAEEANEAANQQPRTDAEGNVIPALTEEEKAARRRAREEALRAAEEAANVNSKSKSKKAKAKGDGTTHLKKNSRPFKTKKARDRTPSMELAIQKHYEQITADAIATSFPSRDHMLHAWRFMPFGATVVTLMRPTRQVLQKLIDRRGIRMETDEESTANNRRREKGLAIAIADADAAANDTADANTSNRALKRKQSSRRGKGSQKGNVWWQVKAAADTFEDGRDGGESLPVFDVSQIVRIHHRRRSLDPDDIVAAALAKSIPSSDAVATAVMIGEGRAVSPSTSARSVTRVTRSRLVPLMPSAAPVRDSQHSRLAIVGAAPNSSSSSRAVTPARSFVVNGNARSFSPSSSSPPSRANLESQQQQRSVSVTSISTTTSASAAVAGVAPPPRRDTTFGYSYPFPRVESQQSLRSGGTFDFDALSNALGDVVANRNKSGAAGGDRKGTGDGSSAFFLTHAAADAEEGPAGLAVVGASAPIYAVMMKDRKAKRNRRFSHFDNDGGGGNDNAHHNDARSGIGGGEAVPLTVYASSYSHPNPFGSPQYHRQQFTASAMTREERSRHRAIVESHMAEGDTHQRKPPKPILPKSTIPYTEETVLRDAPFFPHFLPRSRPVTTNAAASTSATVRLQEALRKEKEVRDAFLESPEDKARRRAAEKKARRGFRNNNTDDDNDTRDALDVSDDESGTDETRSNTNSEERRNDLATSAATGEGVPTSHLTPMEIIGQDRRNPRSAISKGTLHGRDDLTRTMGTAVTPGRAQSVASRRQYVGRAANALLPPISPSMVSAGVKKVAHEQAKARAEALAVMEARQHALGANTNSSVGGKTATVMVGGLPRSLLHPPPSPLSPSRGATPSKAHHLRPISRSSTTHNTITGNEMEGSPSSFSAFAASASSAASLLDAATPTAAKPPTSSSSLHRSRVKAAEGFSVKGLSVGGTSSPARSASTPARGASRGGGFTTTSRTATPSLSLSAARSQPAKKRVAGASNLNDNDDAAVDDNDDLSAIPRESSIGNFSQNPSFVGLAGFANATNNTTTRKGLQQQLQRRSNSGRNNNTRAASSGRRSLAGSVASFRTLGGESATANVEGILKPTTQAALRSAIKSSSYLAPTQFALRHSIDRVADVQRDLLKLLEGLRWDMMR